MQVEPHALRLTAANTLDLVRRYDVIVTAVDNFPTRYLLNDACVLERKTLVDGAVLRMVLGCDDGLACQMGKRLVGRPSAQRLADGLPYDFQPFRTYVDLPDFVPGFHRKHRALVQQPVQPFLHDRQLLHRGR